MEAFFNSLLGKVIRWIFFLPAAIVVAIAVRFIIFYLRIDGLSEYMIEYIPTHIIINFGAAFAFLITIRIIVPAFKKRITLSIGSLLILLNIASILYSYSDQPFLPSGNEVLEITTLGGISSTIGFLFGIISSLDHD